MKPPELQRALEMLAGGDAAGAAAACAAVLQSQPDNAAAHCGLGAALRVQQKISEAAKYFRYAVDLAPDCVDALVGQGECCLDLGELDDARDCFELARAHAPESVAALCGLGRWFRVTGDFSAAVQAFRHALDLSGSDADIYFELGLALNGAEDTAGAVDAYEHALAIAPRHLGALVNLGLVCLTQSVDHARAQQLFEAARTFHPDAVAAQANYGLALQEQGHFGQAIAHYDALIARQADVIEYRWNRALACLYLGDYGNGWPDYELRHVRGGRDVRRDFGLPEWDGRNPAQPQLLVYAEQGVGDEIMFASCLPQLAAGAGGVVLECDPRLAGLFARSFPGIRVHGVVRDGNRDWLRQHHALDAQVAIGSLPRWLRESAADFPASAGYLMPDAARVAAWQQRLTGGNSAVTIGLSWRGGTRKTRAGLRSLELADFLPLAGSRRRYVCLQRGDCNAEIKAARNAGMEILHWPEALDDLEETAALIAALDRVISVDNTVVHLAGALGKPCWTLLASMPDWRYGLEGASMPWYPSLHLFRQPRSRDWSPVIAAVAGELAAFAAS